MTENAQTKDEAIERMVRAGNEWLEARDSYEEARGALNAAIQDAHCEYPELTLEELMLHSGMSRSQVHRVVVAGYGVDVDATLAPAGA